MAFSLSVAVRRTGSLNDRSCAPLLRAWMLSAAKNDADAKILVLARLKTLEIEKTERMDHAVAARMTEVTNSTKLSKKSELERVVEPVRAPPRV